MNKIKIAGVDISSGSITVVILDELPQIEMREFTKRFKARTFKAEDIDEFLALDFDAAVLEPTGGHYSKLWAERIRQSGREVRWVGHREVKGYRESYRLPDKTDRTDAIALACWGVERWDRPGYFLGERGDTQIQLRDLYLQLHFLNRSGAPLINRIKQQLAHECPELAHKDNKRAWTAPVPGLWKAISGEASPKWQKLITNSKGLGLSQFSAELARQLIGSETAQQRIELELESMLVLPEFEPYLKAFKPLHFGRRAEVAILSQVYPFEKFRGHRNPLGAFKLSCGLAQVWIQSGNFEGWSAGGNAETRKALWLWAFVVITQERITSPELAALRDYYRNGTDVIEDGELKHLEPGKGNQRLMRVVRRALTIVYRRLKAELQAN